MLDLRAIIEPFLPVYQDDYDEEQLRRRTQDLSHSTDLSDRECIVLAGDEMDLTDKEISLLIRSTRGTVKRVRSRLRQKVLEHSASKNAVDAIEDAYGTTR